MTQDHTRFHVKHVACWSLREGSKVFDAVIHLLPTCEACTCQRYNLCRCLRGSRGILGVFPVLVAVASGDRGMREIGMDETA